VRFFAGRSIALRLVVSALFWSFLILLIAGLILSALYRDTTERAFDARLLVYATDLATDLVTPGEGGRRDVALAGDPKFELPLQGWYWQIGQPNARPRDVRTSRSLVGGTLPALPREDWERRRGEVRKGYVQGPDERRLRLIERDIDLGEDGWRIVSVAGPAGEIDAEVRRFVLALTVTFALLGLMLGLSTLLQIRFGLEPLARLRKAVSSVRQGEAERIAGTYPHDVAPLANELNLLIDTNREILGRARTQVGNLAHALKTPLSVVVNEVESAPPELAKTVREQAALMRDQVEYHLERARAAALAGTLGTLTEVAPVLEGLTRTFAKIYRDKALALTVDCAPGVRFRGERQDLEEMAGNLIDNACKWARHQVGVTASLVSDGDRTWLRLAIEDDGPGLPADKHADVLLRGQRLDETKPGSGLGLSIVSDLAALYRGSVTLAPSALGGLKAELDLPGDRAV
jgi:signal transduction histidine kinase